MVHQRLQMVAGGVALRLPVLGHNVAHIELQGVRLDDGLRHPLHQQIGDHTGVEAPRPQQDQVRLPDGLQGGGQGPGPLRDQGHMVDPAVLLLFEVIDLGLPHHPGAVLKDSLQLHIGAGHRDHTAGNGQHLAHLRDRLLKGAGHPVQGGQDQVAEGLSGQRPLGEPIGEQPLHDGLHIGQGLHTVADVPRWGHPHVPAQHPGAAAVVRYRHHRSEVPGIVFQPPQHGGQSGAAADGDDARPALPLLAVGNGFQHGVLLLSPVRSGPGPGGPPPRDSPPAERPPPRRGPPPPSGAVLRCSPPRWSARSFPPPHTGAEDR